MPAASPESLFGAVWVPGDGHLDPHTVTHAVAKAARELGATHPHGNARHRDRARVRIARCGRVLTDQGPIETEVVVNAAGIWSPRVAAMAGVSIPSTPVDHQHIALKAVPGSELPAEMPCFRDPDNLVYGKSEQGGALFGGYEPDPVARWIDGVPWEHGARLALAGLWPGSSSCLAAPRGASRSSPTPRWSSSSAIPTR